MKKFLLTGILFLAFTFGYAQHRIGLKLSPAFSFNRVNSESQYIDYSSNGIGMRFIFGPTFDYFLGENYYISTGLLYAPKRTAVTGIVNTTREKIDEVYNLQYLQVPATIKLYTNELALDTRLYFQLGGLLEVKIQDKISQGNMNLIRRFRPYDFSTFFGTGVEFRIGVTTVLYGGLSYIRGLTNVATKFSDVQGFDSFTIKNDLIAIDLGITF